ncbi:unnamed protein product [Symbiodinium pilosum]|uniref:Uncharacterized protein n=1 Tax=Symbiodinium pilosum TaxID=2952 RepID=A0A812IU57_SYMPI|nr:unnamed protein product [Symbiodinium pilosum]
MPLAPCVAPELSEDQCMLDLSNCSTLEPGHVCEIACQPPFVGSTPTYSIAVADPDAKSPFNFGSP